MGDSWVNKDFADFPHQLSLIDTMMTEKLVSSRSIKDVSFLMEIYRKGDCHCHSVPIQYQYMTWKSSISYYTTVSSCPLLWFYKQCPESADSNYSLHWNNYFSYCELSVSLYVVMVTYSALFGHIVTEMSFTH